MKEIRRSKLIRTLNDPRCDETELIRKGIDNDKVIKRIILRSFCGMRVSDVHGSVKVLNKRYPWSLKRGLFSE